MVTGENSDLLQTLIGQRTFLCLCAPVLFDDVVRSGINTLKVAKTECLVNAGDEETMMMRWFVNDSQR